MNVPSMIISPTSTIEPAEARVARYDWKTLSDELGGFGCAVIEKLLSPEECRLIAGLYPEEGHFRSHIHMARHGFGKGEYRYFRYPLPDLLRSLRTALYPRLAGVANDWNSRMGFDERYPAEHAAFLKQCHDQGQTRPTPLLLRYVPGDFNCLHQDLYGDIAFPLQLTCFLSRSGQDYEGGEFVLVEQQPRAQSKVEVIAASQGQILVFATRYRPVKGSRGYYRTNLKHGVSRIRRGTRFTLGVIYHDAE